MILYRLYKQANNKKLKKHRREIVNKAFYLNYNPKSKFCTNFYFFIFIKKFFILVILVFLNECTNLVIPMIIFISFTWIIVISIFRIFEQKLMHIALLLGDIALLANIVMVYIIFFINQKL